MAIADLAWRSRLRSVPWARLLWEGAILALAYYSFTLAKNFIHHLPRETALAHAMEVVRLEQTLGIFKEADFQGWLLREARWAVELFNWVHALFYLPALAASFVIGLLLSPQRYRRFRNTALLLLAIAVLIFAIYPLAPPRMLPELGFVDTQRLGQPIDYGEGAHLLSYNRYAAMPSIHYALPLLAALAWASTKVPWLAAAAFLYQALMLAAIIATGHHFFLDAGVAALAVGAALGIARLFRAVSEARRDRTPPGKR